MLYARKNIALWNFRRSPHSEGAALSAVSSPGASRRRRSRFAGAAIAAWRRWVISSLGAPRASDQRGAAPDCRRRLSVIGSPSAPKPRGWSRALRGANKRESTPPPRPGVPPGNSRSSAEGVPSWDCRLKSIFGPASAYKIHHAHERALSRRLTSSRVPSKLPAVVPARDQKGTRYVGRRSPQSRGCPRNCKRRVSGHSATGSDAPGKAAGDSDPRARRSATGNGHARARRAGCPGEFSPVVVQSV